MVWQPYGEAVTNFISAPYKGNRMGEKTIERSVFSFITFIVLTNEMKLCLAYAEITCLKEENSFTIYIRFIHFLFLTSLETTLNKGDSNVHGNINGYKIKCK